MRWLASSASPPTVRLNSGPILPRWARYWINHGPPPTEARGRVEAEWTRPRVRAIRESAPAQPPSDLTGALGHCVVPRVTATATGCAAGHSMQETVVPSRQTDPLTAVLRTGVGSRPGFLDWGEAPPAAHVHPVDSAVRGASIHLQDFSIPLITCMKRSL